MKRAFLILAVILGVLVMRATAHSAEMKVTLLPQAEVRTSQLVQLKDLAKVEAAKGLGQRMGEVAITNAPQPGEQRSLEAGYVKLRLSAAGFANIKFTGAPGVTITGKCIRISPKQQEDIVKEFVLAQLPSEGFAYDVAVDRPSREMILPDEPGVDIKARLFSSAVHPGLNTVAVEATQDGRTILTRSAVARITATATVLMASGTIAQGQPLTTANTITERRNVTKIKDPIRQTADTQNWIARRTIQPGTVITSSDVALPPAIKIGETVSLTVKCGNVALRISAEAKQEGHIGDSIQVKSEMSKESVRARISGPGAVEIVR